MNIGNKKSNKEVQVYRMTHRLPSLDHEVICILKNGRPFHGVAKETVLNGHKTVYIHDLSFNGGIDVTSIHKWFYLDEFIDFLDSDDEENKPEPKKEVSE